jgi:CrcB protein
VNGILAVALGGAIGSVARYLFNIEATRQFGSNFPWGIFGVNIIGSFAIGILAALFAVRLNASQEFRSFLVTGVLGGFTTFSSFILDIGNMIERKQMAMAFAYALGSVGIGVLALFLALWLVRVVYA